MRILIAEDEIISRKILQRAVEKFGHECLAAADGLEAWELFLETVEVDVVISDWMMPGIDGLEFCRRLREEKRDEYTYFIFLTALGDKAHLLEGLRAGADDYLAKPLDRDELQARLVAASRVTSLHRRLAEQSRRLSELAVLKADFTAMVVHELDSPLAAIRGFTEMLGTGELNPGDQAKTISAIQAELDALGALVADVKDAAAVERDDFAVQLRAVPLDVLLADAVAFAKTLPDSHPFTANIATNEEVWADRGRIRQVLRNLLSNAAKYSPDGAPIELRAVHSETPERIRIEVADHGQGIHPDDMNRIFEKFGRGRDQSGQKVAGVGLGLYLSRRILQAHGSELELECTLGAGCVFGFELQEALQA
jgi:signal transduction histidine kinase